MRYISLILISLLEMLGVKQKKIRATKLYPGPNLSRNKVYFC